MSLELVLIKNFNGIPHSSVYKIFTEIEPWNQTMALLQQLCLEFFGNIIDIYFPFSALFLARILHDPSSPPRLILSPSNTTAYWWKRVVLEETQYTLNRIDAGNRLVIIQIHIISIRKNGGKRSTPTNFENEYQNLI